MTTTLRQCLLCKWYNGENSCSAFADIPDEIAYNRHDHIKPYPGDGGIRFEPAQDENPPKG